MITSKDEAVFIRKPTAAEKRGGAARSKGYRAIPKRDGFDIVYKQFGPGGTREGEGYYYISSAWHMNFCPNCGSSLTEVLRSEVEIDAGLRDLIRKARKNPAVKKLWRTLSLPLPKAVSQLIKFFRKDLDDAMDEVLEHIAPNMVKAVVNDEVQEQIDAFVEKKGRKPLPIERKQIIRRVHDEVEHKITEESILHIGKGVVKSLNPKVIFKYVKEMVKIHGWKIGIAIAIVETIENAVVPYVMIALGFPQLAWVGSAFPTEVTVYPLIFKKIFKVDLPKELSRGTRAGHVSWFCELFPEERLCREAYV